MPEAPINPALSPQPEGGALIGEMRARVAVAFAVYGAEMGEADRIAVASALANDSPVVSIVGAFDVLSRVEGETPVMHALGPVLLSRAIEVADIIAAHSFHGKGDAAAAFATAARARLAEVG